jgi:hypothetical protein
MVSLYRTNTHHDAKAVVISDAIAAGGGYTDESIRKQDDVQSRHPRIPSPNTLRYFTCFVVSVMVVIKKCIANAAAQTFSGAN